MIEALIRTKTKASLGKRRGDVICVKLSSDKNIWGKEESRFHQVVPWHDAQLEKELLNQLQESGEEPIIVTPYKIFGKYLIEGSVYDVLETRSKKYFDIESIEDKLLKTRIINDDSYVSFDEIYSLDFEPLIKTKSGEEISLEFEKNKKIKKIDVLSGKPVKSEEYRNINKQELEILKYYSRQLRFIHGIDTKITEEGKLICLRTGNEIDFTT
jgi:hypothetical protein